ncbi:unnamed protein product [Rhizophagus irregularis]|nr:unnamed protein product [Rhizophagus irregularis]
MTNLKEWINMKVNDEIIKYFEYNKFSDIEDIAKGGFHQEVFRFPHISTVFDVDFHVDFKRKKIPDVGIVRSANWIDAGIKVALKSPLINSEIDENQMENFVKESNNSSRLGMPAYIDPQCYIKNNYKRNEKSDIYSLEVADSKLVNLSLPNNANVLKEANWIESSKLQFNSKIQFNTISSMKNPYSNI